MLWNTIALVNDVTTKEVSPKEIQSTSDATQESTPSQYKQAALHITSQTRRDSYKIY